MIPIDQLEVRDTALCEIVCGEGVKGIRPFFAAGNRCGQQKLRLIDSSTAETRDAIPDKSVVTIA